VRAFASPNSGPIKANLILTHLLKLRIQYCWTMKRTESMPGGRKRLTAYTKHKCTSDRLELESASPDRCCTELLLTFISNIAWGLSI